MKCLVLPLVLVAAQAAFVLDTSWAPQLPNGTDRFTAAAVVGDIVYVGQRNLSYAQPLLLLNRTTGRLLAAEGRQFVAEGAGFGLHGLNAALIPAPQLWMTDVFNFSVVIATAGINGRVVARLGTPGKAGSGVEPTLQFGNVADVDFDLERAVAFISDGDGGVNSRVVAVDMATLKPLWAAGRNGSGSGQFSSPHSLAFHPPSGTVLVADRGNQRIVQLSAVTGAVIDTMDVAPLAPWGLRFHSQTHTLLMADGQDQVCGVPLGFGVSYCSTNSPQSIPRLPHQDHPRSRCQAVRAQRARAQDDNADDCRGQGRLRGAARAGRRPRAGRRLCGLRHRATLQRAKICGAVVKFGGE
jgi:hypothetical protein